MVQILIILIAVNTVFDIITMVQPRVRFYRWYLQQEANLLAAWRFKAKCPPLLDHVPAAQVCLRVLWVF